MIIDWGKYDLNEAKDIASKFGKAAVAEMAFNIQQMHLIDKGNLLKSLKATTRTKQGFVDRVEFAYEWYGKFHEVGASNIFGNGENLLAKRWRSLAIENNIDSLNTDFGQFYASLIIKEIEIDSVKMNM